MLILSSIYRRRSGLMLIIFDQPLFELITLFLCGQSLLFLSRCYCTRTGAYCYGVKPIIINNNLLFSIVFVKFEKVRIFGSPCHVPRLRRKTAYRVFVTPDATFSPVFPVYFFSYCSRIITYCFLLCLSKRRLWR